MSTTVVASGVLNAPAAGRLTLAGGALVTLVRVLTLPRSPWEYDENLFTAAVTHFEPLLHHPHPPGFPLFVALGKLFALLLQDPFRSLVALSLLSAPIGYLALVAAFRCILGGPAEAEPRAVLAALLVHLSPAMLVHGTLALSDPAALMLLSLLLWAGACLLDGGGTRAAIATAVAAAAAIGCRPQLIVPVLPMLAVLLALRRRWTLTLVAGATLLLATLACLLPLVHAAGGWRSFVGYELEQAAHVARRDAGTTRGHRSALSIAAHFLLDAWGARPLALPLVLLAAWGVVLLLRERRAAALPLAVLGGVHLAFAMRAMDPADGARYAIPGLPLLALGMVQAFTRLSARVGRRLAPVAAGIVIVAGAVYAWPVLAARAAAPSPPSQAIAWAETRLPPDAWVMVSPELRAHVEQSLHARHWFLLGDRAACEARPSSAPVYLLAELDCEGAGAAVFRWPASRAYSHLTRNHYLVVSLTPVGGEPCGAEPRAARCR